MRIRTIQKILKMKMKKINKMYRYFGLALMALMVLAACSENEPVAGVPAVEEKLPLISDDVISGELLVRFDARVSEILERNGRTKSGVAGSMTRSGVLSVDEILDLVEGYEIERVFPVDRRTEDKAREAGLHLWYVVRFSEDHSVSQVAADLAKLGEVSRVDFNRRLKRATAKQAVPLTAEMLAELAETDSQDPLYPFQWYLDNDASLNDFLNKSKSDNQEEVVKFVEGADIGAEEAWAKKCTGHPSIIVAILDEGVDVTHPDLQASMWVNEGEIFGDLEDNDGNGYAGDLHGYNFVRSSGRITVNDRFDSGHGTHVAGTIAARNNNGCGIKSIAGGDGTPDSGVRIMSCQIFSGQYVGTVLDEVRAIKYAADNGAVILQCSWGYISGKANPYEWGQQFKDDDEWMMYNPIEKQALDYFTRTAGSPDGVVDGGIVVYAAGNESAPASSYPGAYKEYVSVAAIAGDYTPAVYTNYGPGTSICAPGGDQDYYYEFGDGMNRGAVGCILSTLPEWHTKDEIAGLGEGFTGYGYMEGTSMACPQVSGVAALGLSYALQKKKHFKAQDFIKLLYDSARNIDGYLDAEKKWYKYVTDLGFNHPSRMVLSDYKGKMGTGLVSAVALLEKIDGADVPEMAFPNVLVQVCACEENAELDNEGNKIYDWKKDRHLKVIDPKIYIDGTVQECTPVDGSVAQIRLLEGKVVIRGIKPGQTRASIKTDSGTQSFVITVKANSGNGLL